MPEVTVNKLKIYYELHGPPDAEVVVLTNGVLMSTVSWAFQRMALSKRYRLLLYDCRGMWRSGHPPGPYSMDLHADDLAGLLDALGIESAHIGGTSYGAEISMVFALKYPARTRSLLVTSAVSHVEPALRAHIEGWHEAARSHDPDRLFRAVCPLTFSDHWLAANPDVMELGGARYKTLDFDSFASLLASFSKLDITDELKRISAPTLVVAGEHDVLKPRYYSEIIAAGIPGSEFALIPGTGHAAFLEKPGEFNTLLLGFLLKQERSPG